VCHVLRVPRQICQPPDVAILLRQIDLPRRLVQEAHAVDRERCPPHSGHCDTDPRGMFLAYPTCRVTKTKTNAIANCNPPPRIRTHNPCGNVSILSSATRAAERHRKHFQQGFMRSIRGGGFAVCDCVGLGFVTRQGWAKQGTCRADRYRNVRSVVGQRSRSTACASCTRRRGRSICRGVSQTVRSGWHICRWDSQDVAHAIRAAQFRHLV